MAVNHIIHLLEKILTAAGVGLFEGNYYGEFDNYRPTFCSIMDSCSSGGYGDVNVEGFAIGSIQNQGFITHLMMLILVLLKVICLGDDR